MDDIFDFFCHTGRLLLDNIYVTYLPVNENGVEDIFHVLFKAPAAIIAVGVKEKPQVVIKIRDTGEQLVRRKALP